MALEATVGLAAVVAVGCQTRMLCRHASMPCVKADTTCEDASFRVSLDVLYYMMLLHDCFLDSLVGLTRVPLYLTAAKVHLHLILSRSTPDRLWLRARAGTSPSRSELIVPIQHLHLPHNPYDCKMADLPSEPQDGHPEQFNEDVVSEEARVQVVSSTFCVPS